MSGTTRKQPPLPRKMSCWNQCQWKQGHAVAMSQQGLGSTMPNVWVWVGGLSCMHRQYHFFGRGHSLCTSLRQSLTFDRGPKYGPCASDYYCSHCIWLPDHDSIQEFCIERQWNDVLLPTLCIPHPALIEMSEKGRRSLAPLFQSLLPDR